jgi:PKD repeat protein
VNFEDQSWVFEGEITAWYWDFDDSFADDDTSSRQNTAYLYAFGG